MEEREGKKKSEIWNGRQAEKIVGDKRCLKAVVRKRQKTHRDCCIVTA